MTSHLLFKTLLIFLAGAIFAFLFTNTDILSEKNIKEKGEVMGDQIQKGILQRKEKAKRTATESLTDKILGAITENPILAPIFETKKEVENTINTVKSLPEEQREAICTQICGQ